MYINKAMVYGNLTRDPELKALPSGQNVCKQADNCAKYLKKGGPAFVEGRIQTRSWEKDGVKQYRTEVVADHVQFGPKSEPSKVPNTGIDYPEPELDVEVPF